MQDRDLGNVLAFDEFMKLLSVLCISTEYYWSAEFLLQKDSVVTIYLMASTSYNMTNKIVLNFPFYYLKTWRLSMFNSTGQCLP